MAWGYDQEAIVGKHRLDLGPEGVARAVPDNTVTPLARADKVIE